MKSTRRGFLGILGGATAAAFALDPDKALYVPGARKFFIPARAPRVPMTYFARSVREMEGQPFYPELLHAFIDPPGVSKIGDTIMVRRPQRFRVNVSPGFRREPIVESIDRFLVVGMRPLFADLSGSGIRQGKAIRS